MRKVDYIINLFISILTLSIIWGFDVTLIQYTEDKIFFTFLIITGTILYWMFGKKISQISRTFVVCSSFVLSFMFIGYNLLFFSQNNIIIKILEFLVMAASFSYFVKLGSLIRGFDVKCSLSSKAVSIISFSCMLLASILLLLIYYPGIFSTDVVTCWKQAELIAEPNSRSDAHSFVYIILLAIVQVFTDNIFWVCITNALLLAVHIPLERNSQSATAERLSAPNGKFVVS